MNLCCLRINIRTLTSSFRISPPATRRITTYPFIPPTVLSGYLRRIIDSVHETFRPPSEYLVGRSYTRRELRELEKQNLEPTPINYRFSLYDVASNVSSCGAYLFKDGRIEIPHPQTKHRFGIREFHRYGNRSSFVICSKTEKGYDLARIQDLFIHTWDYILPDFFYGFFVGAEKQIREIHEKISSYRSRKTFYWWRIGKKGIGVITETLEPAKLKSSIDAKTPTAVVPTDDLTALPSKATFYILAVPKQQSEIYETPRIPKLYTFRSFAIIHEPAEVKDGFLVGTLSDGSEVAIPKGTVRLFGRWDHFQ